MEDSSDEENNILKGMGFSNDVISQINKKTRLKHIFSSLSSCTSSIDPPVRKYGRISNRKYSNDEDSAGVSKISPAITPHLQDLPTPAEPIADSFVMADLTNTMISNGSDENSLSVLFDFVEEDLFQSQMTSPSTRGDLLLLDSLENSEKDTQLQPANLEDSPQPACPYSGLQPLSNLINTQKELQSQITDHLSPVQSLPTTPDHLEIEPKMQHTDLAATPQSASSHLGPQSNFIDTRIEQQSRITSTAVQLTTPDSPEIEAQSQSADRTTQMALL